MTIFNIDEAKEELATMFFECARYERPSTDWIAALDTFVSRVTAAATLSQSEYRQVGTCGVRPLQGSESARQIHTDWLPGKPAEGALFQRSVLVSEVVNAQAPTASTETPPTSESEVPLVAKLERPFMFEVGKSYVTQEGLEVTVLNRTTSSGCECLECSDGLYRYDRSTHSEDAGRVTGTNHDYSCPKNFARPDKSWVRTTPKLV